MEVNFTPPAYAFEVGGTPGQKLTDQELAQVGTWLTRHGFPYNGKGQFRREPDGVVTIVTSVGRKQIIPGSVLVIYIGVLSVLDQEAYGLFRTGTVPRDATWQRSTNHP